MKHQIMTGSKAKRHEVCFGMEVSTHGTGDGVRVQLLLRGSCQSSWGPGESPWHARLWPCHLPPELTYTFEQSIKAF